MFNIPVWTYHRVLPSEAPGAVSVEAFRQQLAMLKNAGYRFIDCKELTEIIASDRDPGKCTVISFDDGWADNLIWATPELEKAGAKAVLALNTGLVNGDERSLQAGQAAPFEITKMKKALEAAVYSNKRDEFLTWHEINSMRESGLWDIQAHGNSHFGSFSSLEKVRGFYPEFSHWTMEFALGRKVFNGAPRGEFRSILADPRKSPATEFLEKLEHASSDAERFNICAKAGDQALKTVESEDDFIKRLKNDIFTCSSLIQQRTGIHASAFFWPWGHYSELSTKTVNEAGFKLIFTMDKDIFQSPDQSLQIPRIAAPESPAKMKKQLLVFSNPLLRTCRRIFNSIKGK